MRRRLSLRARVTIGSTVAAVLVLAIASAIVFAQLTGIVEQKEKAVLHGITEVYRGVIQDNPDARFEKPGANQHVAIVAPDGVERMNTLPEGVADRVAEFIADGPRLHSVSTPQEGFYVYVDPVETADGTWYVLATRDADIADDVLSEVILLLTGILLVGALVFALGSWFVTGAALRPVERMRRSAESLAVSRRGELLPVGASRDELADLARTLNDLLERMRAASDRERQMVSDASHELRNPLAVLQAQLQLVDGIDADADAVVLDDARATLTRLTRTADALLQLSRIDSVDGTGSATVSQLSSTLTDSIDRLRLRSTELGPEHELDLDFHVVVDAESAVVPISVDDFGRIVENLVDNSIGAADGPVSVTVTLTQSPAAIELSVSDDAGGFDPDVAQRAFERFVRGSAPTYPGSGLGLAIVARLAQKAGGNARVENRQGVGATVVVTFTASRV